MSHCVKGILALFPRRGRTACRPVICSWARGTLGQNAALAESVHRALCSGERSACSRREKRTASTCSATPTLSPNRRAVYCGRDPKHRSYTLPSPSLTFRVGESESSRGDGRGQTRGQRRGAAGGAASGTRDTELPALRSARHWDTLHFPGFQASDSVLLTELKR